MGWDEQDHDDFKQILQEKYTESWTAVQHEGLGPESIEEIRDGLRGELEQHWQKFTDLLQEERGPIPGRAQSEPSEKTENDPWRAPDLRGRANYPDRSWNEWKPRRDQAGKGNRDHNQPHDSPAPGKGHGKGKSAANYRGERMDVETTQQFTGQGDVEALWQHHDYFHEGEEGAEHLHRALFQPT